MKGRKFPQYVSGFRDRHGKLRTRYRRKGYQTYYFKSEPWGDEWWAEYQACKSGRHAPRVQPGEDRVIPGSLSDLIQRYYSTTEFHDLKASTKKDYLSVIERLRTVHGDKPVIGLQRDHIKAMVQAKKDTPAAANKLLKSLKILMWHARDIGFRTDDPTDGIRKLRMNPDGYHTWTDAEISQFEAHHPSSSRAHLALALMLYTAQRRSDVIRMGRQHIDGDHIRVVQDKTGAAMWIPIHPKLRSALAEAPADHLNFLTTVYGKPFTSNGFGNWFRKVCDEAGLPQCSSHGLRKAASRRLAEAGATDRQIMALTGHKTSKEVTRYTRAAEQKQLANDGIRLIGGIDLANPKKRLDK